jgi:serine/threonine-protein kinase
MRAALVAETFDTPTRAHIQKAIQLRQSLSERDRTLLDAVEPWMHVPPDLRESERRLQAAIAKSPNDADFHALLGTVRHLMRDHKRALVALEDTLARDPMFASAYRLRGREQFALGERDAARVTYKQCLDRSPAPTWCINDLADLDSNEGKCDDAEQLARSLIALDPQSAQGYVRLARAVYGKGDPIEGARVALTQAYLRVPKTLEKVETLSGDHRLAVLEGNFVAAEEALKSWEKEIAANPDEWDHARPLHSRMLLLLETGKQAEAAKLADEYLKRRAAWTPDDFREDPTIYALATKYRAGAMPREAMAQQRAQWLQRELDRPGRIGQLPGDNKGEAWVLAYASPAVTSQDAREALDVLPKFEPLPDDLVRTTVVDDPIGQTYALAGKEEEGLAYLARAAATCGAVDHPIAHTWANFHLGLAREARGDRLGACSAYRVVLDRWGKAKPRSVTADAARARTKAIACNEK